MRLLLILLLLLPGWVFSQHRPPSPAPGDSCRDVSSPKLTQEEGDISTVDFGINSVSLAKSRYPDLRGQGVTICLKEQTPAITDADLRGRVLTTALTSPVTSPHATQMASLLVGAGLSSPLNEGIAPAATLLPVSFGDLLPDQDAFYRLHHVTIVNHSYGTERENFYGAGAVAYDASTYQLPTLLHVFSSGNLGYTSNTTGPYANLPTVATLTGNAKMAKNSLVVGATGADGALLPASSRGPAYDGRIKPELVTFSDEGTSGAAAVVSGVTALLQQALRRQTGTDASAALLKTILINSADEVGGGLNYQAGYGAINAFAALQTVAGKRCLEGEVAAGGVFSTTMAVPAAQRLKITLAWTDPPATLNSPKALVNDLDLTLTDGRSSWQPWVLNPAPHLDSLSKRPVRMRDSLNNVEQITVDVPTAGIYTIQVSGTRVGNDRQPFALAYQWDTPDLFYWVTPNLAMPIISDTTLTIRWKNTTPAQWGRLEFSPDRGNSWQVVQDSVVLATGLLVWKTPDLFTTGQLRMRIGEAVYPTDTFRLSPVPALTISYACADSVGLAWQTRVGGSVASHVLYRLGSQASQWEKIGVFTGSKAVIKPVRPGDAWAVAPVGPDGGVGIRSSFTGDQQVGCYYRLLGAVLIDSLVQLTGELSTTEGVSRVTFQKQTPQGLKELGSQPVTPALTTYTLTDTLLQEGPNAYRMRIGLSDGRVVYSDFTTVFVLRQLPVRLYPNPVERGQQVSVRASDYRGYTLHLTDISGRPVRSYDVPGSEVTLSTTGLAPGLYLYTIFRDDQRIQTGRLLVN